MFQNNAVIAGSEFYTLDIAQCKALLLFSHATHFTSIKLKGEKRHYNKSERCNELNGRCKMNQAKCGSFYWQEGEAGVI